MNSLCFNEEGDKLYTADSAGLIVIWNAYVTEKSSKKGITRDWKHHSDIKLDELRVKEIHRVLWPHSINFPVWFTVCGVVRGVMTRSMVDTLSELCSPVLKVGSSAFIAAIASSLFPQKEYRSLE